MPTTHLLTVSHSICQGVSASGSKGCVCHTPQADIPLGRHPPPGRHTPADIPLGNPPCPVHAGIHTPPVDRQTPVKILPSQTSLAGGKYQYHSCFLISLNCLYKIHVSSQSELYGYMYGKETQYQTFIKVVRNPYSAQPERTEEGLKVQTAFALKSL